MLTAKQAKYADARIAGNDPSAAYRCSYDAERMSAKAISVEANRLENHPAIALAVLEGRRAATEAAIITEQWWLENVKLQAEHGKNPTAALALARDYLGIGKDASDKPLTADDLRSALAAGKDRLRVIQKDA